MNKKTLKQKLEAKKELLSCPGDTIKEELAFRGESFSSVVSKMEITESALQGIICGDLPINESRAKILENYFGPPSSFWLNLQDSYEQELKEIKEMENKLKNK